MALKRLVRFDYGGDFYPLLSWRTLCTSYCPTLDHSIGTAICAFQHISKGYFWMCRRYPRLGILARLYSCHRDGAFSVCFEAVPARDCGATQSADLGTSSKESYWDSNRGWPKRRKVPCCSLVRRGWVSPELLAETALKRLLLCSRVRISGGAGPFLVARDRSVTLPRCWPCDE